MSERYHFRAATLEGQVRDGVIEAPSRTQVLEELHARRLFPLTVEAAATRAAGTRSFLGRRAAVTVWARDLATLLDAGLPLDRALSVTAEHSTHRGLAEVLREIRRSVQGGSGLAEAIGRHRRYFPPVVEAMVAAGEATGALETVFDRIAEHLEETAELRAQVRGSLLYPALMGVVACIGVTVLLLFVVPRFSAMLADIGGRLPLTTRLLVASSEFLTGFWWVWLPALALIAYGARRALQRPDTRLGWHRSRLRLPWVGELELKYATSRFSQTLAILLRSGVAIVPALRIARSAIPNEAVGAGVDRAADSVAEGSALSSALAGTLPHLAVQMIAVGEESGRLDDLCGRVASTYDADVRRALRALVAMIEPTMILIFGALVGFIALAMLQAIYSINTNVF